MACSMVNRVVARVLIPRVVSSRYAWSPSYVAATLIQRRWIGKLGAIREVKAAVPGDTQVGQLLLLRR